MTKITKRFVESITPDSERKLIFWDTELKGFCLTVWPSGRRTYSYQYRNPQRIQKRFKIGVHGQITAEEARTQALLRAATVAKGEDPASSRKIEHKPTFLDLVTEYRSKHAIGKREKSKLEDMKMLENHILPCFGKKDLADIHTRDVQTMHLSLKKTPYLANRVLALLSKIFSLACLWGYRADNPVKGIPKFPEEKRTRWLSQEELDRLWVALDGHTENTVARVIMFLLLTGARKGEALGATWDQIDLERGVWTKPAHLTKQKKNEHLPLSQQAIELLREIEQEKSEGTYVFPGRVKGQPLKEIKAFWAKLLKEADLTNVRIHDLRHTYASHLVSQGLSLSVVGRLLGHTQASTTQRYAHLADEPLRAATELFSRKIVQKSLDKEDTSK